MVGSEVDCLLAVGLLHHFAQAVPTLGGPELALVVCHLLGLGVNP